MSRKITVTATGVVLPSPVDVVSLASYVASLISFTVGIILISNPHLLSAQTDVALQATVPLISLLIAGGIQVVNIWRNASAKNKAITSGDPVFRMTRSDYESIHSGTTNSSIAMETKAHIIATR